MLFLSGGIILLALREKYLEDATFYQNVIAPIQTLSDQGLWRIKEKEKTTNYFDGCSGLLYILIKNIPR